MTGICKTGAWLAGFGGFAIALMAVPALAAPATPAPGPARGLPDDQLSPLSLTMQREGERLRNAHQYEAAMDQFESALAADPRNRNAWLGMADTAGRLGLPGTAIRYYREALAIDPNDVQVLAAQGDLLASRGARARAEANLARIRTLCATPCPPADQLAGAIARSAAQPADTRPADVKASATPAPPATAPAPPASEPAK